MDKITEGNKRQCKTTKRVLLLVYNYVVLDYDFVAVQNHFGIRQYDFSGAENDLERDGFDFVERDYAFAVGFKNIH